MSNAELFRLYIKTICGIYKSNCIFALRKILSVYVKYLYIYFFFVVILLFYLLDLRLVDINNSIDLLLCSVFFYSRLLLLRLFEICFIFYFCGDN